MNTRNLRASTARQARIRRKTSRRAHPSSLCEPLEARRLLANAFEFFAGRVVVEAEQFDSKTTASGHSWQLVAGRDRWGDESIAGQWREHQPEHRQHLPAPGLPDQLPACGRLQHLRSRQGGVGGSGHVRQPARGPEWRVQSGADRFAGFGTDFAWESESMDQPGRFRDDHQCPHRRRTHREPVHA